MSDGLDFIDEVNDDLGERKLVLEDGLAAACQLLSEGASPRLAQQLQFLGELVRSHDGAVTHWLHEVLGPILVWGIGCTVDIYDLLSKKLKYVFSLDLAFVRHARRCEDGLNAELVLKALPEDVHVQHAQKAAAETTAQSGAALPDVSDSWVSQH